MLGREIHQLTNLVCMDTDTIKELVDIEIYLEKWKFALETAHIV